jgi:hypothetical protein
VAGSAGFPEFSRRFRQARLQAEPGISRPVRKNQRIAGFQAGGIGFSAAREHVMDVLSG